MKILSFGYDTSLLLPEELTNEGQYRQTRYCELLGQEKAFVILNSGFPHRERFLANGRVWVVSASGRWIGQQIVHAYLRGLQVAKRFKPDLVEYQDPRLAGLLAYFTARALKRPLTGGVFNDFLDNPTWLGSSPRRRIGNRVGQWVLQHSTCVRCDSAETTEALKRKGYTQVRYIPFFIPWLEKFTVSDEIQNSRLTRWQEDPLVLCVARLSEEKNVALLLRAFAQVCAETRRGRLAMAGSGPLEAELAQLASQLGIHQRVTWLGLVDYATLLRLYGEANVFALSSNSETSARVLILAQTARLPTVTTATSGSRAVVSEGRSGYVTPIGDEAAMVSALRGLLTDRARYRQMLFSPGYYDYVQHGEAGVMPRLREFYESALKSC
jgi:glycosyltransferase involved in cell wall biosynthesis